MKKKGLCLLLALMLIIAAIPMSASAVVLRRGSSGAAVRQLQTNLIQLGMLQGAADGKYGEKTVNAVKLFQFTYGLKMDGKAGTQTLAAIATALNMAGISANNAAGNNTAAGTTGSTDPESLKVNLPTRTLREGYTGTDVTQLQITLNALGYPVYATGKYDAQTLSAVRSFQRANNMHPDGVCGKNTYEAIRTQLNTMGSYTITRPAPTTRPDGKVTDYVAPTRTMKMYCFGEDVLNVQMRLSELGYSAQHNSVVDKVMVDIVRAFQVRNGLKADGIAGPSTYAVLFSSAAKGPYDYVEVTAAPVVAPAPTQAPAVNVTEPDGDGTVNNNLTLNQGTSVEVPGTPDTGDAVTYVPTTGNNFTTYTTLRKGSTGSAVNELQTRLLALGYSVTVNGNYDAQTVAAVNAFQANNYLKVDGIAGKATQTALFSANAKDVHAIPNATYTTLSVETKDGDANLLKLQNRLCELGYLSAANGSFDAATHNAVVAFQRTNGLLISGIADGNTQDRLYSASAIAGSTPSGFSAGSLSTTAAPTNVKALWWYSEVKHLASAGQQAKVYDPATGLSWTIQFYAMGKHADSEPLTLADTQTMNASFGKTSWNCHAVYVLLPSGDWTIAAMHNYPHLKGNITDNGFGGHLCIHFLRTYEECKAAGDTNYGVQMQDCIRKQWKALTGETIN